MQPRLQFKELRGDTDYDERELLARTVAALQILRDSLGSLTLIAHLCLRVVVLRA
jgi:hypothetical protein